MPAEIEGGHLSADLPPGRPPGNQQGKSYEPGGSHQAAAQIEGKPEEMPVGEERRSRRRELSRPPPVCQEGGGPAAGKEQNNQRGEHRGKAPPASRQLRLTAQTVKGKR